MKKRFEVLVVGNLDEKYEVWAEHRQDAEVEAERLFLDEHSGHWSGVVSEAEECDDG